MTKYALSSTAKLVFVVIGLLITVFMGAFVALFASTVGEHYGILLAVPAAMIIGLLFIFERYTLIFLIILFRSALDPIFDTTRLGSIGLGAILNALVILIALIELIKYPHPARKVLSQTWLPFLIISALTIVIAPEFITALKSYLVILSYAAVFTIAITLIKTEEDFGRWMRAIFMSSIIPVLYAFIDISQGGYNTQGSEGFRINSTFSHPNVFAFYLVLMVSLCFYFYKTKAGYIPHFIRRTLPLYILIMLGLLMLTKTRSAWASCFVFFVMYAVYFERKYLIYILLGGILGLLVPDIRERITDLGQGNEVINYSKLNSYAWRKLIWESGIKFMSFSHYFLGYGLEAFKHYSVDFFAMAGGVQRGAHSVYVQLFFDTGFFGVLAFIWANIKTASLLTQFYKQNKLLIFSSVMFLLEFALNAYSDNMLSYLSFNWYLWFVLGLVFAFYQQKRNALLQDESNLKPV